MISDKGSDPTVATRRWSAIGTWCEIVVSVPEADADEAARIADAAQQRAAVLIVELDLACSRFRDDSELTQLRHGTAVTITPMLDAAVSAALRTAHATGGLVDPTVASALSETGYDEDLDTVRARVESASDRDPGGAAAEPVGSAAPGYWRVMHDPADRRILVPHRVEIDLGASAKAWLADTIAQQLVRQLIIPLGGAVLVNLGGDIAVAGPAPEGGWRITVDDGTPGADDHPVVIIRGGGIATSSTTLRTWRHHGRQRHHIVDPRTGDTAPTTWRAVTVAARSCELANAASTAAVVLGENAPGWLTAKGVHARLRHLDGSLVTVGGWPEEAAA